MSVDWNWDNPASNGHAVGNENRYRSELQAETLLGGHRVFVLASLGVNLSRIVGFAENYVLRRLPTVPPSAASFLTNGTPP